MTMVLPTFAETKVGRADGLSWDTMRTLQDSSMIYFYVLEII